MLAHQTEPYIQGLRAISFTFFSFGMSLSSKTLSNVVSQSKKRPDEGAFPQGPPVGHQCQGNLAQGASIGHIQALFCLLSSRIYTDLGNQFGDRPMVKIGRVLLCWTP